MYKELLDYLLKEEEYAFTGWDFSYLNNRMTKEMLPWSYNDIVNEYLIDSHNILDMGTGGGELLLSFKHPYQNTSVTEAYPPNIKLCQEKLTPLGITVYPILDDDKLINIGDNLFDIVLNHHESYDIKEVKRVLKDNGLFITQQVGAYNNYDLISYFDENYKIKFPDVTLDKAIKSLEENGFEIIYKNQYFSKNHFLDLGALVYFAKIIKWEFVDFSVERYIDKLEKLNEILKNKGYIESTEDRFMIVAKKK